MSGSTRVLLHRGKRRKYRPDCRLSGNPPDVESPKPTKIDARADATASIAAPESPLLSHLSLRWAVAFIVVSTITAYANSFYGVFVFDDFGAIVDNMTIRHLWDIERILMPPPNGETVSGRPLLNLSLTVDYAIGGIRPLGYHVTNLIIHISAALILLGTIRRTLLLPRMKQLWGRHALPLAAATAALWAVHPVQTESVTYIVQRAESLCGLCYLFTLYCFIRGAESSAIDSRTINVALAGGKLPPVRVQTGFQNVIYKLTLNKPWLAASVLCCLLGMAAKEVAVTAPVIVLLYDRTFISGSFRQAIRERRGYYFSLAATWALLVGLVASTGLLTHRAEHDTIDPLWYASSQPAVILYYLQLCLWPDFLCLDYNWPPPAAIWEVLPYATVLAVLCAAVAWGVVKNKTWGFLGAWFFLILAPTSSIVPLWALANEHRLYLPLAAVLLLVVGGGLSMSRLLVRREWLAASKVAPAGVFVFAIAGTAFPCLTYLRNEDYYSGQAMWEDVLAKSANNETAHNNLGNELADKGQLSEAIFHYRRAIEIKPDYAMAHNNLGSSLADAGQFDEAVEQFRVALKIDPYYAKAYGNLGRALAQQGRSEEAVAQYRRALQIDPYLADTHCNLAVALAARGQLDEAINHYHKTLEIRPHDAPAHNNLANALRRKGNSKEALEHYRQSLELKPQSADTHKNLGFLLFELGRIQEALSQWRETLNLQPNNVLVLNKMAWVLAAWPDESVRNGTEAVLLARRAVKEGKSDNPYLFDVLAASCAESGQFSEAVEAAEKALALAAAKGDSTLADALGNRIKLYKSGIAFHGAKTPSESQP
jgi:protein O-mannosyl-transferase